MLIPVFNDNYQETSAYKAGREAFIHSLATDNSSDANPYQHEGGLNSERYAFFTGWYDEKCKNIGNKFPTPQKNEQKEEKSQEPTTTDR